MYIPKHFSITDNQEIFAFIEAHAFGQLISTLNGQLYVSHVPFAVCKNAQSLVCHIAKSNQQWQEIEAQEMLVTFQGNHAYVSPSWYESPGVPTWNYQAVHVYGRPRLITDSLALKNIVEQLSETYESNLDSSWKPEYKANLIELIVGIEIQISEIQCKYKLSQNRSEIDRHNVIKALQKNGATELAEEMKKGL